jgi:AbrB family looped-hinge helix DNA binding protein
MLKVTEFMTVTVKDKTPLVVPPAVRRRAGLKSGDQLEFEVSAGVITIRPKVQRDAQDPLELSDQRQIQQSNADIRAGRTRPASELLAELQGSGRKIRRRRRVA